MRNYSKKIAIVGTPNVGKSVLFNKLTGNYVIVSNYPGTTVEVYRGKIEVDNIEYEIIDTPGMYSFLSLTEEEKVARRILINENISLIIHVVDAKNLERMLSLTFQLIETNIPVILVLNMMDEAIKEGVTINIPLLEKELNIPVIPATLIKEEGLDELKETIKKINTDIRNISSPYIKIDYNLEGLGKIEEILKKEYGISKKSLAILLLEEDEEIKEIIKKEEPDNFEEINLIISNEKKKSINPLEYEIALKRQEKVKNIIDKVLTIDENKITFNEKLSRLMMNPFTGFPILFLVLYLGLYKFVGNFGAGTVVNFLEQSVFQKIINPFFINIITHIIPYKSLQDLFIGEYGIITLGFRYAVALILPLVTFFFIVFSIIEDTGYLPRLAMLIDRTFKKIGLSGRAVIPMVLGFACDTMATMVTRTLPTKRERLISTILLALAVPCSAQLGIMIALLQDKPKLLAIWGFIIALVFLLIGYLSSKILPGEKPSFYMELPTLRVPNISNIVIKTYIRVKWYFKEVFPLFILASFLIWLGNLTGIFEIIVNFLKKPVNFIGLPSETAKIFLFGFFRRDYGTAGLYDLNLQGKLNNLQLLISTVTLTLFLPCIAQFLMNIKERGLKIGVSISLFVLFFSFSIAYLLNFILTNCGVII